ncbi:MAG: transglycosylase domain-containing protein, partial [Candidatus Roizmanbacteria bacterium]|nr:transglycosylase domain-containing protein [Candidatus Roizmanbacteria bacterium]
MKQFLNSLTLKKKLFILGMFFMLVLVGISAGVYLIIFKDLPTASSLKNLNAIPFSTHIYDRNGKILYEIYRDQNRTPVKLNDLKPYIYQASIAIEDKDFYHHQGISLTSGVLRAIKELVLRQTLQGGSTITQQLVKNALLSSERTLQRKIREMILAVSVEKQFSKQEILEMYINQVPYGGSAYGVEEGAKTFFGKKAKDLKLEEAALLAGLPQAPSLYSPYINPTLTINRRNEVLQKMYEQKYITLDQEKTAMAAPLTVIPLNTVMHAPHFVFYVKSLLEKEYGADLVEQGGLKVTTTLDLDIQEKAEQILKDEVEKIQYLDVGNGALLITRPPTGEILAMVGSADYYATGSGAFNVTTALRQPGSSIKPLNYAVGIDRKFVTAGTVFLDIPTCFTAGGQPGSYCPVNYDGQFHGPTQLRFALGNSYNIPAVKMLAVNGVKDFIASASAFTITSFEDPTRYGLSLTLGGGEVRMTEMAQAFSAFANQGVPRKLNQILKIEDRYGKVLYRFDDPNIITDVKKAVPAPSALSIPGKRAISKDTSYIISHILLDDNARSAAFGAGSYLVVPGKAVSVKTGTTDDKKDNWTIGY